jgi:hypothetical protein
MAVVSKYGVWDNATYPWTDQTSAGVMGSIVSEIDGWISAISTNASIVANGQLPVKIRDPNSSTNAGVTNGFVYEFPDTTIGQGALGPTWPTFKFQGTATATSIQVGDQYLDTTANNGYGDFSSATGHYSSVAYAGDAGYSVQAIIAYDIIDGQEFFAVGMKMGTGTSDEISFGFFKDTSGHWCFCTMEEAFCYDTVLNYWTGEFGPYDTDPVMAITSTWDPLYVWASVSTGAATFPGYENSLQGFWYSANSAMYSGRHTSSKFGSYSDVESGKQILTLSYSGLAVLINV